MTQEKIKFYLDTSAISFLRQEQSPDKTADTLEFWELLKASPNAEVVISEIAMREINGCGESKLAFLQRKLVELKYVQLKETDEHRTLAEIYRNSNILTEKSRNDLLHIATAVVERCNYIVSWNFKHFLNPRTIEAVNAVNRQYNLSEISLVAPTMLLGGF
ncbi:MAG: PIN domain-containing protein [Oscillospiraceae bacterium]|jgi:predicted nucleic acid-binding protein|nr:PIN domain-containing protein [Oscillospiraceae bacterium]